MKYNLCYGAQSDKNYASEELNKMKLHSTSGKQRKICIFVLVFLFKIFFYLLKEIIPQLVTVQPIHQSRTSPLLLSKGNASEHQLSVKPAYRHWLSVPSLKKKIRL